MNQDTSQDTKQVDVLIGGAGFAGLALALALRQALGPSFAVAVADPSVSTTSFWETGANPPPFS